MRVSILTRNDVQLTSCETKDASEILGTTPKCSVLKTNLVGITYTAKLDNLFMLWDEGQYGISVDYSTGLKLRSGMDKIVPDSRVVFNYYCVPGEDS